MQHDRSSALFERAKQAIPGGVNSPARAFRAVGGVPPFIARGDGAWMYDVDGNGYIDLIGSWGPLIYGHRPPPVREALIRQIGLGTTFGAPTEMETELTEAIRAAMPTCRKVRLVSSGTEATMSAIRVARGFTGRPRIVKFEGCYHGHADALLAKAGSGVATLGLPDSAGVPAGQTADTLTLPYNDVAAVDDLFAGSGPDIACVIVEPVVGNMGCVPPNDGFLQSLRDITRRYGSVLIFDEVMTGFRLARGGAQELFGIEPDMTTLGKVVGGGLPLAAYAGRQDIMDCVAPAGPVYQAGTLSGNPMAVAAGLATLRMIEADPGLYARLEERGQRLADGLTAAAQGAGVPAIVNRVGSMLTVFFQAGPVFDYATAKASDTARFARFHHAMLERGVYLPPSQFEAAFLSDALTGEDESAIIAAAKESFRVAISEG